MFRLIAPALFVFFWSTGFIVARAVLPHADVQLFLFCRFGSVAVLLGAATMIAHVPWPRPAEIGRHLLTGAVMMGIYLVLSYWAIAHGLPAGIMALMGALQPLLTAFIMLARGRSRPSFTMWLGLLIGFSGVVLVLLPRLENSRFALANSAGIIAGVLSVAALTLGTLAQKRLAADDLRVAGFLQNVGAAAVAVLALAGFGTVRWDDTAALWGILLWAVLVSSILSQGLLMWMLRSGEATRVTALMLLVPPLAAAMTYFLFGETLMPIQLIGFALALTGVVLARRIVSRSS
jgi:drug/metabolite transporter (DMT)-like permease